MHLKNSEARVLPMGIQSLCFVTTIKHMSQTSFSPQCSINDGAEFKAVADAMKVIGFKQEEIQTVYKIVAAILHLVSSLPAGLSRLLFRSQAAHLYFLQI